MPVTVPARSGASEVGQPAGGIPGWLAALPPGAQRAIRAGYHRLPGSLRRALGGSRPGLDRERIAGWYLRGSGIEIGALHQPVPAPRSARVSYVDRFPAETLRREMPELAPYPMVRVDIVDDGERLESIGDGTQDFVIANHVLEHCQDPIGALVSMFRVLRPDGVLYLAVPDKRYTFDVDRPVTPLEHLLRDHRDGPAWSCRQHCEEWVRLVERLTAPEEVEARIVELMERNHSIHVHVWTQTEMLEFLVALRRLVAFDVELIAKSGSEVIVVVRKGPTKG